MRGLDKGIICVVALTLLVVVMPVGCSDEQKKNAATIKRGLAEPIRIEISDANTHKNINLETIFDSVTFVPLSNAPKAAVSGINQAIVIDSTILILDRYGSKSVKAFSLAGEFLADIGHRGRGPGEYIEPTMMEVNPCKEVVIWDQFRQQLLHYDLGGKYIKSREYPFFSMKFHEFDDNNLMFVSFNSDNKSFVKDYSLFVSDSLGVVSKYGLYRKKNTYETILYDHDFFEKNGDVFYHPVYCDTVFRINGNFVAEPYCWLDFGKKTVPERLRDIRNRKEIRSEQSGDRYFFMIGDFYMSDNHLFFEFLRSHHNYRVLYTKSKDKAIVFNATSGFFPVPFNNFVGSTDNAFIGYFFPVESIRRMQGLDLNNRDVLEKQFGKRMTDLMCSMKNDDNPILTFFYPKSEW